LKAQQQKEKFEAQLAKKENSEVSYGSGTTKSAPSYGSGTDAAPAVQSYGSKTLKTESVVKKVDHVKVDGDYVMREGDFIKDKAPASSSLPINCPAGSTAQSNGTCLLTSGSFPSE